MLIGDKMPLIKIDVLEGISKDIKKKIESKVRENVYGLFRETPAHNHYTRVEPLHKRVPYDE